MPTVFLLIIYLAFISLGLPDSLLGVNWYLIHRDFNISTEALGIFTMTIALGTITSSFISGYLIRRFRTGLLTFLSTLLTALALLGMAFAPSIFGFWLFAIPLGLGAGAVDVALNNYVANYYKSRHMNWLHCFWGVGAMAGPLIMGFMLDEHTWRDGYLLIALIQFVLVLVLLISLPFWKKTEPKAETKASKPTNIKLFSIKGVKLALIAFAFYTATEAALSSWGSTYLIHARNLTPSTAAVWVATFYGGITIGRFLVGIISNKVGNKLLIRLGQLTALIGVLLLILPLPHILVLIGFILIGLGCAPIYPSMLHETPARFGSNISQVLIGFQMGFAYIGSTFLPPLMGLIASNTSMHLIPYFVLGFIIVMFLSSETLNRRQTI